MTGATVVIMLCDIYLSWVVHVGPKVGHAAPPLICGSFLKANT